MLEIKKDMILLTRGDSLYLTVNMENRIGDKTETYEIKPDDVLRVTIKCESEKVLQKTFVGTNQIHLTSQETKIGCGDCVLFVKLIHANGDSYTVAKYRFILGDGDE